MSWRLPISHPAAVKLRTIQHPCRPVRIIPQRSTVKSSAPGLEAQLGWMPHKFTTHSLCYALLYPEGGEKCVALVRWARSLSTYQEKELSLKKRERNPSGCAVRRLAALSVTCNLDWVWKAAFVVWKQESIFILKCWFKHLSECAWAVDKDNHFRGLPVSTLHTHTHTYR